MLVVELDDLLSQGRSAALERLLLRSFQRQVDDGIPLEVLAIALSGPPYRGSSNRWDRSSCRLSKNQRSIDKFSVLPSRRGRGRRTTWTPFVDELQDEVGLVDVLQPGLAELAEVVDAERDAEDMGFQPYAASSDRRSSEPAAAAAGRHGAGRRGITALRAADPAAFAPRRRGGVPRERAGPGRARRRRRAPDRPRRPAPTARAPASPPRPRGRDRGPRGERRGRRATPSAAEQRPPPSWPRAPGAARRRRRGAPPASRSAIASSRRPSRDRSAALARWPSTKPLTWSSPTVYARSASRGSPARSYSAPSRGTPRP